MKAILAVVVFLAAGSLYGQADDPVHRRIEHFEIKDRSRLVALAAIGASAKISLLVEAGDVDFLQQPITLARDRRSAGELIQLVLSGSEQYVIVPRGSLVVMNPTYPKRPLNRLLTMPLGPFKFSGKAISSLDPYLAFRIQEATGCHPTGYGWSGPALDLDIPSMALEAATFEDIVEAVANAPEPTMWIVGPNSGMSGCLDNPSEMWEVGFYNYSLSQISSAFLQSSGPDFVK